MAITCNLNEKEFDYIYGMTKTFIQNKIDNDQVFDISSYLDYLYERIKRAASKSPNPTERAATLLSQTPAIIEAVINRNFNKPEFDKYFMDLAKLAQLKRKFSQKDIEIAINTLIYELQDRNLLPSGLRVYVLPDEPEKSDDRWYLTPNGLGFWELNK